MALPINITDLLNKQKIESNRIEFKKGWNPESIYHSICAFANDFDDLGGGYILVGVDTDEATGMAIRPVEGVQLEKLDGILKDMVGYNNKFAPYYLPRTSVEEVDGKQVLVIWCPAGINRPYSIPENVTAKRTKEYFYIRSGTSSIIAKGDVLDELRDLAVRVPFDEATATLGSRIDTVYSASKRGGSVSFPRISPDGRYMLYTWAECGTFPIHHKEADLRMMAISDSLPFRDVDVSALNSKDVDSYHSWSSSGRWVVFSSKRIDGRYTRLFLSHWDGHRFSKPMMLPQRDPEHNVQRMYSYNIPEFIKAPALFDPDEMAALFKID